jgi:hypothetical protein
MCNSALRKEGILFENSTEHKFWGGLGTVCGSMISGRGVQNDQNPL